MHKPTPRDVGAVLEELPQRVSALLKKYESSHSDSFEHFERELHQVFAHAECAVTEQALARHDVDLPFVFIDGVKHHRACRSAQTYLTAAGPASVTRTLYRARRAERAVAALERRAGIVEGYWTPLAARHSALLVSHLTPRDAAQVLATLGPMQPSKSSLDRLPKALSARWEAQRETFEATVREASVEVPEAARAVVVSLDGVMTPMRGGYREAGCATVSLVDGDGERLHSVRMGRMPHSCKVSLKAMLAAEVEAVLDRRPDLTVVKLADGARDNWTCLTGALPDGVELIDFYHAAEQLSDAFDAAYGTHSPKAMAQFKLYRHRLRHECEGVERVIRALLHLRAKHPHKERISQVLGYFRNHRRRMGYAEAKARGLPSAPGWSRPLARPWSPNGSSAPACDGGSPAGRPFSPCARSSKANDSTTRGLCLRTRIEPTWLVRITWCLFDGPTCLCTDQFWGHTHRGKEGYASRQPDSYGFRAETLSNSARQAPF